MLLRALALAATVLCIAASASAAPKSDDDDNRRGHAFGLLLHQKNDDLASHARSAIRLALSDRPLGRHDISLDREPRGNAYGHHKLHGLKWKPTGKTPRPVTAIPEPSGALLFGAAFGLVALRLRRNR